MAILQNSMDAQAQAPTQAQPVQGNLPAPNPAITSPLIKDHMDELAKMEASMPPEQKDAYDRVLVAGKKMLYAKETANAIDKIITDENIPVPNKLGEGVANLVVMMDNQGNGTIPKEVIVPVAVSLLFEAADYLYECGIDVTPEDLGSATSLMVYSIFNAYGMPKEQVDQMVGDLSAKLGLESEGAAETETEDGVEEPEAEMESGDAEEAAFNQGFNKQQGM